MALPLGIVAVLMMGDFCHRAPESDEQRAVDHFRRRNRPRRGGLMPGIGWSDLGWKSVLVSMGIHSIYNALSLVLEKIGVQLPRASIWGFFKRTKPTAESPHDKTVLASGRADFEQVQDDHSKVEVPSAPLTETGVKPVVSLIPRPDRPAEIRTLLTSLKTDEAAWNEYKRPILQLIAVAREPVSLNFLLSHVTVQQDAVEAFLKDLDSVLFKGKAQDPAGPVKGYGEDWHLAGQLWSIISNMIFRSLWRKKTGRMGLT